MSYLDTLNNSKFTIRTGDGEVFTPLWKPGETSKEYNTSAYDFINLAGTRIDRKKPKSSKYPLTFWFQGDDHISESESFLTSADDPRAWEIEHPYYGNITGQPLSISRNDSNYGITEITVDFWESITVDFPDDAISMQDRITAKAVSLKSAAALSFEAAAPGTPTIAPMKIGATQTNANFVDLAGEYKVDYQNKYSAALKAADALVKYPRQAIQATQSLLEAPARFIAPINQKLNSFESVFNDLIGLVSTKEDKNYYESTSATLVAAMCECAINPQENDYSTRPELEIVVANLLNTYNAYQQNLDTLTVGPYEVSKNWTANADVQAELKSLVVDTVANLQQLSFEARQERVIYTENHTNLIVLTHRFIGLPTDENLKTFRTINTIKNDEVFQIKKDRRIVYYN